MNIPLRQEKDVGCKIPSSVQEQTEKSMPTGAPYKYPAN